MDLEERMKEAVKAGDHESPRRAGATVDNAREGLYIVIGFRGVVAVLMIRPDNDLPTQGLYLHNTS